MSRSIAIDILEGASGAWPVTTCMDEIRRVFDQREDISIMLRKFTKLEGHETLQEHVKRQIEISLPLAPIGPACERCLIYFSPMHVRTEFRTMELEAAAK